MKRHRLTRANAIALVAVCLMSLICASGCNEIFREPDQTDNRNMSAGDLIRDNNNNSSGEWTELNVGVLMASHLDSPFDLERCGPAVDLALERVNTEFLQEHRIRLRKVQGR